MRDRVIVDNGDGSSGYDPKRSRQIGVIGYIYQVLWLGDRLSFAGFWQEWNNGGRWRSTSGQRDGED